MKISKLFLLVAAAALLMGFANGAFAQRKISPAVMPPIPITTKVSAIEVTDGTFGYDTQREETMYGYTFLGRTSGEYPGSFILSMNCSPAFPIAGGETAVSSGSWTLPVYANSLKGSSYAGSLYGTIAKGSMIFDKVGNADVYIQLNVNGGTQTWDGVTGYATFTGTLVHDEKHDVTTLTGTLEFNIK